MIRAYPRGRDAGALMTAMGPGASDIAQVVPEVRERLPGLPESPPLVADQARFRFFDSLAACFMRAAAVQPLLLILDDLHWADAPSLLLLQFLAHELRQSRVLVLGTFRDTEIERGHPLVQTLAELARLPGAERVPLRGLSNEDVTQFITSITGVASPGRIVQTVAEHTEGNPFFVTEVVRLLASGASGTAGRAATH